eukprot:2109673-Pyramimonas_sp.AAC.1
MPGVSACGGVSYATPVASGAGSATDADGRVAGLSTGALDQGLVVLGFGDEDVFRRNPGIPGSLETHSRYPSMH